MTIQEFRETIWNDLEFEYKGRWYYICPFDDKYSCGEADKDDKIFYSIEDMLEHFIVQEKPLKDILPDINF